MLFSLYKMESNFDLSSIKLFVSAWNAKLLNMIDGFTVLIDGSRLRRHLLT